MNRYPEANPHFTGKLNQKLLFPNYPIAMCAGRDSEIDAGKAFNLLHLPLASKKRLKSLGYF
jgi:hypothetical protein